MQYKLLKLNSGTDSVTRCSESEPESDNHENQTQSHEFMIQIRSLNLFEQEPTCLQSQLKICSVTNLAIFFGEHSFYITVNKVMWWIG